MDLLPLERGIGGNPGFTDQDTHSFVVIVFEVRKVKALSCENPQDLG
jgi:hypothetical protein